MKIFSFFVDLTSHFDNIQLENWIISFGKRWVSDDLETLLSWDCRIIKNVKLSVKLPIVHLFSASWDDSRISITRALTDVDIVNVIQDILRSWRSKNPNKEDSTAACGWLIVNDFLSVSFSANHIPVFHWFLFVPCRQWFNSCTLEFRIKKSGRKFWFRLGFVC